MGHWNQNVQEKSLHPAALKGDFGRKNDNNRSFQQFALAKLVGEWEQYQRGKTGEHVPESQLPTGRCLA